MIPNEKPSAPTKNDDAEIDRALLMRCVIAAKQLQRETPTGVAAR